MADKGYFKSEDIAACEKAGLTPHVPKPQRGAAVANGFFRKDEFRYDAAQDAYVCPGRHELKPIRQGRLRDMRKVDYANARACRDCPLRPRCTNNYRAVSRLENEDALDRMAARLGQRPDILARRLFRQFTLLCRELNLFGRELLAVDGTRIKAVNNKDRNFTKNSLEKFIKAVDKRLDEYLRRLDESDVEEAATDGSRTKNLAVKIEALREKRGRYGALLTELERSGESQISLTDPDSRAMAAHTKVAVGYNIQVAVDAKNKMIVDQEVTNQVVDMGLLTQTAEPAGAILEVEAIDVVADRGYFKIEDIEACEKAGMTPYVPKPQRGSSVSNGFFRKDEFRYDAERDAFICPAGQVLSTRYESKLRELTKIDYSNRAACLVCAIKSRCTKDYRKVSRLENEAVLDRMAARLKARPEILDRRREMVEHPFGSIKQWMNQGAFLMKGLDNVRAEFSLTALVYNLRRALNILGVEAMMAAARG